MTETDLNDLSRRILSGERPVRELWELRNTPIPTDADRETLEALSDLWGLAFHFSGLMPPLEAAKSLVEVAIIGDTPYPLVTNEGAIYDCLRAEDRAALVAYVVDRMGEPAPGTALRQFIRDIMGDGNFGQQPLSG